MPTMRSLACSLAWLVMDCGACCSAIFCSALATTLEKTEACFWWLRRVVLFASNLLTCCAIWTRSDTHSIQSPYVRMARNNSNWGEPKRAPHWSWQQPTYYYLTFSPTFVAPWFPRSMYVLKYSVYWRAHVHDLQLNSRDQRRLVALLKLYRTHIPNDISTYSFARM